MEQIIKRVKTEMRSEICSGISKLIPVMKIILNLSAKEEKEMMANFSRNNDESYAWAIEGAFNNDSSTCITQKDRQLLLLTRFTHFVLVDQNNEDEYEEQEYT